MNKKQKYILTVLGIFAGYCIIVYFIRRSMGISSTLENILEYRRASISQKELIARYNEILKDAPEQLPTDLLDIYEGPNR
jgi:hypothetical protein